MYTLKLGEKEAVVLEDKFRNIPRNDITIRFLSKHPNTGKIKLGVSAPYWISIHRKTA